MLFELVLCQEIIHLEEIKLILRGPPHCLFGDQIYAQVEHYQMVITNDDFTKKDFRKKGITA